VDAQSVINWRPCKNDRVDRYAVRGVDTYAPRNHELDGTGSPEPTHGKGLFGIHIPDGHKVKINGWTIPTDVAWSVCKAPDWPVLH